MGIWLANRVIHLVPRLFLFGHMGELFELGLELGRVFGGFRRKFFALDRAAALIYRNFLYE